MYAAPVPVAPSSPRADLKVELNEGRHVLATWRNVLLQGFASEARIGTLKRSSEILRRLASTHPEGVGFMIIVSHSGRPPEHECRSEWVAQMSAASTRVVLVLFEGQSFRASLVRGVVTGLVMLARPTARVLTDEKASEGVPRFTAEMAKRKASCGTASELEAALLATKQLLAPP